MPKDIHLQLIDPTEQTFGAVFTFNSSVALVDGLQKLANRWVKIFCTPLGSNCLRPSEGTDFPYLMGSNIGDARSVEATVAEYITSATDQIRAIDARSPWLALSERILSADLERLVVLDGTRIEFWVKITNRAKQSMRALIPYAVTTNG